MDWSGGNFYYSGQGVALLGPRVASTGKPAGLIPIGNVSSLKLAIATSVLDHKENQSGNRTVDFRLPTEIKGTITMVLENVNAKNLAMGFRGDRTDQLAGTVSAEAITGYLGSVTPTKYVQITSQVVKRGATTLTAFVADGTPWDYKVNLTAGSLLFNDGSVSLVDKITTGGTAPTVVTVGNPTVITVANTAVVGDRAVFTGFTGADAALLNGKSFEIVVASATQVSLNVDTTGKTITLGTPVSFFDGGALTVDYSYAAQKIVNALTKAITERYMRFEGLNTADSNNPRVVEVFRCIFDPIKDLDYLSDNFEQMTLEGEMLYDSTRASGSNYFKDTMMR